MPEEWRIAQSQYSIDFESETETSNKDKQKVKQYSRTTPNTPILPKTTAKHLQTPKQETKPILTSANIIEYLQEIESNSSKNLKSEETKSEQKETIKNKEEMTTAYIAKISEFTGENNNTSSQEWLDKVQKAGDTNGWNAARMLKAILYFLQGTAEEWFENLKELFENCQAFKDAFLQQFNDNNTSITLHNCFYNIKQETSETILNQFIAGLKDKLIKKNYAMAIEEANHTKLVNLTIRETTTLQTNNNSNNKDINHPNNAIKTILDYHPTTKLKIVIIVEFQDTGNEITENCKETNKTGVINITLYHNNLITNLHYKLIIYQDHKIKTISPTQQYQVPAKRLVQHNQFTFQNQFQNNNNRINPNNQLQKPNYYYTQPNYLTIPEKSDFQQTALSEDEIAAPRSNPSNNTIPPAQIAQNANLSDIFPFEFEANESPFLLSNAAANEQKAITVMYTEATLMQQLQRTVDRPAQTVIVTADGIKKTPVGEIDNFLFTIDRITIPVKVLVMDAPQYQALVRNNWLLKANANLDWETQELKISYQKQYTIVPATCSTFNKQSEKAPVFEFEEEKEMPLTKTYMALGLTSNWAKKTKQEIFEESRGWKKVKYSTPEPRKQPPYIPLKCKDCNKKLSSMEACISSEEEYETCICYFCKTCHKERFGYPKKKKCNWIDVAMREKVCDQICQYALSISEKVRKRTLFDAAYNSALNKLYHYPHDAEMIFDLAIALINEATQEDVHQMKEAEYIEYTIELAGFNYENEIETYHQIASHTYPIQEAQIQ
ncbi:hypothetical protein G9A89_009476 [Geosiphon pyriformis]|nr:hypothetical protein G9A89_009476 [Geosiphon pyriformis]